MSDAERIMAKAEREIEDVPVTSDQQDFGDGADSYLIAVIAGISGLVLIALGLVVVFTMDIIGEYVASSAISFIASIGLYIGMGIWITLVGFKAKPAHGIACICTGFAYCIVFGFMQGKTLLMPTIVMIFSGVIGLASGLYTAYKGWTPEEQGAMIFEAAKTMFMG